VTCFLSPIFIKSHQSLIATESLSRPVASLTPPLLLISLTRNLNHVARPRVGQPFKAFPVDPKHDTMDPAFVVPFTIQLFIAMNRLAGGCFPYSRRHLDSIPGELKVLRTILGESILTMESMPGPLPESASVASERCVELEEMLDRTLHFLGFTVPDGATSRPNVKKYVLSLRRLSYEDELREIMQSFRVAVLLLRDITTE